MIWPIPTIPIIWGEPHKTFHKPFHGTHETPLDLLEGALAVPDHARSVKLGSCMTISFRLSSARQLKLGLEFFCLQMSAVFHSSRFLSKLRKRVKSCPVSVQCAGRPLPHSYIVQRWGFIELVLHGIALKNPVLVLKSMRWKPTTYSSSSTIHQLSWIYHGFPQPLIGVIPPHLRHQCCHDCSPPPSYWSYLIKFNNTAINHHDRRPNETTIIRNMFQHHLVWYPEAHRIVNKVPGEFLPEPRLLGHIW